jgi:hypothetical protein
MAYRKHGTRAVDSVPDIRYIPGMSNARPTPKNHAAPLPVLYQREAADDATGARRNYERGDMVGAAIRQRHAAYSSAKARALMGLES